MESTKKKLLEVIHEFIKTVVRKMNTHTHKLVDNLKILFKIASKNKKYLWIYLIRNVKDLYTGNYKALLNDNKEDVSKRRKLFLMTWRIQCY